MKKIVFLSFLILWIMTLVGCDINSAARHYKKGNELFENGKYEEAVKEFGIAITSNSNRSEYYISYGMAFIKVGNYDEAIKQFDQVYMDKKIKIVKENNKKALRGKGIAYYMKRDYAMALEQFDAALQIRELSDLDVDILYYKGSVQIAMSKYQEAFETYNFLLSNDEDEKSAIAGRALASFKLNDYKNSLKDYNKLITLDPKDFEAYFGKFHVLLALDKKEEALSTLTEASKVEIKSKEDKFNLAKVYYYQENYDTALPLFVEGSEEGFTEAYYYIGQIYEVRKDYESAIYYYKKQIDQGQNLISNIYNQLSFCNIKIGNYKEALNYIEQGFELNNADAQQALKKNEIVVYEGLGEFQVAYEKVIEYRKTYPKDKDAIKEEEFIKTRIEK